MKKIGVLLQMILLGVFMHGASFGSQSGQAQQQTPSQSGEESANNSSPDGSRNTQARSQKDQTDKSLDESEKGFAALRKDRPKRRPAASHPKAAPSRQLRSAKTPPAKDLQTPALQNVPDSHQISPTLSSNVPGKTVGHSSRPVSPSTVALNGQQFKNSRDPGARMATSGGPATSTRGTAAINGTDVKRKP